MTERVGENYSCGKTALQCDEATEFWLDYLGGRHASVRSTDARTRVREREEKRVARAGANVVTRVYTYGLRDDVRSRTAWVRFSLTDGPEWTRVLAHRNAARCNATRRAARERLAARPGI